jgi:hypothetical protein
MPTIATRQAAKFWVGLVGAVLAAVVASTPDAPPAFGIALAVVTALGVYVTPNAQPPADDLDVIEGDH